MNSLNRSMVHLAVTLVVLLHLVHFSLQSHGPPSSSYYSTGFPYRQSGNNRNSRDRYSGPPSSYKSQPHWSYNNIGNGYGSNPKRADRYYQRPPPSSRQYPHLPGRKLPLTATTSSLFARSPNFHSQHKKNLHLQHLPAMARHEGPMGGEIGQPSAAVENDKIISLLSQYLQGRIKERRHSSRLLSSFGSRVDDSQ